MSTVFMTPEFQIIKEQISSEDTTSIVMAQGAIESLLKGDAGPLPDSVIQALKDLDKYFDSSPSNRNRITQRKMDDCLYTILGCIKHR